MLRVENLTHRFEDRTVLHGINLEVPKGEILAIMGSSGGGKTTLLRCVSGLLRPSEGAIWVGEINVTDQPEEARRHTGLVFQSAALFDYLNVANNVLFGVRRQRHLGRRKERELLNELLEAVGLVGTERRMPAELSGGMRKRVGLARALAMKPDLILYDEPTSGLDPVTAYSIDRLISDTRDRYQVTSVVVSHDVTSVFRVADKIAFLDQGKLGFLGSVDEFRLIENEAINELVVKSQAESFLDADEEEALNKP